MLITINNSSIEQLKQLLEQNLNLDSNFFNSNNELHSSIRDILIELTNEIMASLRSDYDIEFIPVFVILTGSLCSVNYDEYSDVDFHVGVDKSTFPLNKRELIIKTLALFAQRWNQNKYTLKGRSLELYFQDADEKHISPGIYDILHNHWIKVPDEIKVEVNGNIDKVADDYKNNIQTMIDKYNAVQIKSREFINDTLENTKIYWKSIRDMRKESIKSDGLYGTGNLIFKRMRRNNALSLLINFMRQLKQDYINAKE